MSDSLILGWGGPAQQPNQQGKLDDVMQQANLMVADLVVQPDLPRSEDLLMNRSALLQTAVAICLCSGQIILIAFAALAA